MEYSPSLRSECTVLPYHKGLIIKKHFYLYSDLIIIGFICILISFGLDIQQVVSDPQQNLTQWKKYVAKERRIILEGVHDRIFTNLHGKETPYAMW